MKVLNLWIFSESPFIGRRRLWKGISSYQVSLYMSSGGKTPVQPRMRHLVNGNPSGVQPTSSMAPYYCMKQWACFCKELKVSSLVGGYFMATRLSRLGSQRESYTSFHLIELNPSQGNCGRKYLSNPIEWEERDTQISVSRANPYFPMAIGKRGQ